MTAAGLSWVALVAAAACVVLTLNAVQVEAQPPGFVECANCFTGCFAGCSAKCGQCSLGTGTEAEKCRKCMPGCLIPCYWGKCHGQRGCSSDLSPYSLCSDCKELWCGISCTRDKVAKQACQPECHKDLLAPECVECTDRAKERCKETCYDRECLVEHLCTGSPQVCSECNASCDARCVADEFAKNLCLDCEEGSKFAAYCYACIDRGARACRAACYARDCVAKHGCAPEKGPLPLQLIFSSSSPSP